MRLKDHLEKLPLLLAIADLGSLRQAGIRVGLSQPAVSRSVKLLESAAGGELVLRTSQGASLTPRGYAVLGLAKEIEQSVHRYESRVDALDTRLSGRIRVGTYESIAIYHWPKILRDLQSALPNVEINVCTGRSAAVLRGLMRGDFDLVVTVSPEPRRGLVSYELYRDFFGIYGVEELDLRKASTVIAFDEATQLFAADLKAALRRLRIKATRHITTDSFEVVRAMTAAGVGVGVLPSRVAMSEARLGEPPMRSLTGESLRAASEHVVAASVLALRREQKAVCVAIDMLRARTATPLRG